MSAISTEVTLETFKFLPRFTLDRLLLVCRQWNQLIKSFERQLSLRRLMARYSVLSEFTTVDIELTKTIHPIDSWLDNVSVNHISVSKKFIHHKNQLIGPEGPHKALFSFLNSHIRNSAFSLTFPSELFSLWCDMPPGVMCLIKDLIEGQLQRNCSIIGIYKLKRKTKLNYEISPFGLGKASFLTSNHSISLIKPIRDANEAGRLMKLIDHCKVVFPNANRSRKPAPELTVTSHFRHNFPEQFIEIFKHSTKDDWPEQIVVKIIRKGYSSCQATLLVVFLREMPSARDPETLVKTPRLFRVQGVVSHLSTSRSRV
ncbi:hypothetical protein DdX_20368 [Ditylenchus destructor]|uniref:F-box domain-containing protein n=1 Tax=Ditylenchus destructor TaxID=166010 RepID=A0AAD4MHC0_9BILA|nr:hypothetical protein DdX_20368 [Ditylenchus destructor]